jgi:hypothetical protein
LQLLTSTPVLCFGGVCVLGLLIYFGWNNSGYSTELSQSAQGPDSFNNPNLSANHSNSSDVVSLKLPVVNFNDTIHTQPCRVTDLTKTTSIPDLSSIHIDIETLNNTISRSVSIPDLSNTNIFWDESYWSSLIRLMIQSKDWIA